MNKRKREADNKKLEEGDSIEEIEEAVEEKMQIDDDEKSASSEGEGDDLMENMER
jgi:hypothetical protein